MLNSINIKKITSTSLLSVLMAGSFFSQAALSDTQAVTIDSNSGYLDWTDVSSADANGWERIGNNGERDDLVNVYYHSQDNLYIKVSVDQKWNWGGMNKAIEKNQLPSFLSQYENSSDPYPNSPKIANYSYWGTGNFDEHETLLFTNSVKNGLGSNTLTIEYFSDAALTQKAEVETLNFTLTDLDGTSVREKIVMNATDALGNNPQIGFDRPENSQIDDSQMTSNTIVAYNGDITDEKGNVGVVVNGKTHKIEILYTVYNPENQGNSDRHMYVSDLAWSGNSAPLVPGTDINISQFYTPFSSSIIAAD